MRGSNGSASEGQRGLLWELGLGRDQERHVRAEGAAKALAMRDPVPGAGATGEHHRKACLCGTEELFTSPEEPSFTGPTPAHLDSVPQGISS